MRSEFVQKWASQVKKGTLSFIVMKLLSGNELYGYDLIERVKRHTEIEIAEGTLYPLLNRLKKQDLLESKWGWYALVGVVSIAVRVNKPYTPAYNASKIQPASESDDNTSHGMKNSRTTVTA